MTSQLGIFLEHGLDTIGVIKDYLDSLQSASQHSDITPIVQKHLEELTDLNFEAKTFKPVDLTHSAEYKNLDILVMNIARLQTKLEKLESGIRGGAAEIQSDVMTGASLKSPKIDHERPTDPHVLQHIISTSITHSKQEFIAHPAPVKAFQTTPVFAENFQEYNARFRTFFNLNSPLTKPQYFVRHLPGFLANALDDRSIKTFGDLDQKKVFKIINDDARTPTTTWSIDNDVFSIDTTPSKTSPQVVGEKIFRALAQKNIPHQLAEYIMTCMHQGAFALVEHYLVNSLMPMSTRGNASIPFQYKISDDAETQRIFKEQLPGISYHFDTETRTLTNSIKYKIFDIYTPQEINALISTKTIVNFFQEPNLARGNGYIIYNLESDFIPFSNGKSS